MNSNRWRSWSGILSASSWALLIVVVAQWILIRFLGDAWWLGTVALFAPRWPLLAPLAVVAAASALWYRRMLWVNLASALLLAGPVMGFCVPISSYAPHIQDFQLRLMTINTGSGAQTELLRAEIERVDPDIVAFQEFGRRSPADLVDSEWHWQTADGVAIASKFPILKFEKLSAGTFGRYGHVSLRVVLQTPAGNVQVCSLHLNTPRRGFEDLELTRNGLFGMEAVEENTRKRDLESAAVRQWLVEGKEPLLIAGDFNQPPESWFFRRDWSEFQDAFLRAGSGYGHTWFSSWHGVRIDHILADYDWQIISAEVGNPTGGDHRPLIADLVLTAQDKG